MPGRGGGADAEAAAQEAIDAALAARPALNEPAVHRALGRALADGEQVLLASSMPIRDAESFSGGGAADVRFFSNRGANGIDGLDLDRLRPRAGGGGRPTWAVLGDLALAHDLGGLACAGGASACRCGSSSIDNGGGGIFEFLPQAGQVERGAFERLFTHPVRARLRGGGGALRHPLRRVDDPADARDRAPRSRVRC